MSSVKDVAKLAGVSPSTVSRYIRNACNISAPKREKIKQSIKQLGYVPNFNASILKSNRSNLVGLILPSEHNLFFSLLISRLYEALSGKKLIVLYSKNNEEVKSNIQTLLSLKVSSVLFVPVKYSDSIARIAEKNDCYFLQLFIDCFPQFDALTINDDLGAYLAVKKLLDNGHRRILLLDINNDVFKQRYKGYTRAFTERGLTADPLGALTVDGGEDLETALINRLSEYPATAVISVTEVLSQQCMQVFNTRGITVPNDISLITYDDSMWAKLCGHTAVRQPLDEVVDGIKGLIDGETERPKKVVIDPVIVDRNSCADLNGL